MRIDQNLDSANDELTVFSLCSCCVHGDDYRARLYHSGPLDVPASDRALPSVTTQQAAENLTRWGISWADGDAVTTITYGLLSDAAAEDLGPGHIGFSNDEISVVEHVFDLIEEVANIEFVRVEGRLSDRSQADIAFMTEAGAVQAFAAINSSFVSIRSVVVNVHDHSNRPDYAIDNLDYETTLHEILHAVGLAHPGDYDGADARNYGQDAPYREDTLQYSVMSYWSSRITGSGTRQGSEDHSPPLHVQTPQLHDVAALQGLYGANTQTRSGDTVYGFSSNAGPIWDLDETDRRQDAVFGTIWDGGGHDTIDGSRSEAHQFLNLLPNAFSSLHGYNLNVAIAEGVVIEDAIGGYGNDSLQGNEADNALYGGPGSDTLWGGDGDDVLYGDDGNLGPVRILGTADNNRLEGNGRSNEIDGGDGEDTLIGGEGADTLIGGEGRDVIVLTPDDFADGGYGTELRFTDELGGVEVVLDAGQTSFSHLARFADGTTAEFMGTNNIIGTDFGDVFDLLSSSFVSAHGGAGDDLIFTSGRGVYGGVGNDTLVGGGRVDLYGGDGADVFALLDDTSGIDVMDFVIGEDLIDLRGKRLMVENGNSRTLGYDDLEFVEYNGGQATGVTALIETSYGSVRMAIDVFGVVAEELTESAFLFS